MNTLTDFFGVVSGCAVYGELVNLKRVSPQAISFLFHLSTFSGRQAKHYSPGVQLGHQIVYVVGHGGGSTGTLFFAGRIEHTGQTYPYTESRDKVTFRDAVNRRGGVSGGEGISPKIDKMAATKRSLSRNLTAMKVLLSFSPLNV